MTPNNKMPVNTSPGNKVGHGKGRPEAISRIKMLLAAGAVAGTFGGWAVLAQQNTATADQPGTTEATATVTALVQSATPTSALQATAVLQEAIEATATVTPGTVAAEATATTAAPTDTPTVVPTATATAKAAAVSTPKAVTTTKSSQ
jgi:hypothetical protein